MSRTAVPRKRPISAVCCFANLYRVSVERSREYHRIEPHPAHVYSYVLVYLCPMECA